MKDPRDLDVRTVHRHLQKGRLTHEDYEAHLAALPDLEAESEFVDYDSQFREEAKHEAGPPPPVFVGAEPVEPAPTYTPPPSFEPSSPSPEPSTRGSDGFVGGTEDVPSTSSEPEPSPEPPKSPGFGSGTGWGSGGAPGGFGSSF